MININMEGKSNLLEEVSGILIRFILALIAVGLIAVIAFYIIPELITGDSRGWKSASAGSLTLYYKKDDPPQTPAKETVNRIQSRKQDIISKLKIDKGALPERIAVYIHPDLASLKGEITARKSSSARDIPLGLIDTTTTENVDKLLTRLLTTFSWGKPSSELLRDGLQEYISNGINYPNYRAAALGDLSFGLKDLVKLENSGDYPIDTLEMIYDKFDSPDAPAGLSLAQLSSLISDGKEREYYADYIKYESASLVQYLISTYGMDKFADIWQSYSFAAGIKRTLGTGLSDLEARWQEYLIAETKSQDLLHYLRGKYLSDLGQFPGAKSELNGVGNLPTGIEDMDLIKSKVSFFLADFSQAKTIISRINSDGLSEGTKRELDFYRELLQIYDRAESRAGTNLTIIFTEESIPSAQKVDELYQVTERWKNTFPAALDHDEQYVIILSPGSDTTKATEFLPPTAKIIERSEDPITVLAGLLVNNITRTPTYSGLLKQGLITFFSRDDYVSRGRDLIEQGRWKSVESIVFEGNGYTRGNVEGAAIVKYLIDKYGSGVFLDIWKMTTPLGGDHSLQYSLEKTTGDDLAGVETKAKNYLVTERG